jgi:SAM-dependent methyltransferase
LAQDIDDRVLEDLLPSLHGRRVVDLGSGDGWFGRWAAARGAASVLGLEPFDEETTTLPEWSFDLVYVARALRSFRTVARALAPGGRIVCAAEHRSECFPARFFAHLHSVEESQIATDKRVNVFSALALSRFLSCFENFGADDLSGLSNSHPVERSLFKERELTRRRPSCNEVLSR